MKFSLIVLVLKLNTLAKLSARDVSRSILSYRNFVLFFLWVYWLIYAHTLYDHLLTTFG